MLPTTHLDFIMIYCCVSGNICVCWGI